MLRVMKKGILKFIHSYHSRLQSTNKTNQLHFSFGITIEHYCSHVINVVIACSKIFRVLLETINHVKHEETIEIQSKEIKEEVKSILILKWQNNIVKQKVF